MPSGLFSTTDDEALNQRFGKVDGAHALLHGSNIVRNTPELNGLMLEIGDGETCARVPVARLTDGTGIQEVAPRLFDAQRAERFRRSRTNLQHFEIRV